MWVRWRRLSKSATNCGNNQKQILNSSHKARVLRASKTNRKGWVKRVSRRTILGKTCDKHCGPTIETV